MYFNSGNECAQTIEMYRNGAKVMIHTPVHPIKQESFVDFVLKDSSNEVERVLVIDALEKVLNGGNDNSQTQSMLVKTRMQHRKRILSELCTKPTLISFLKSDEASVLINDWAIGLGNKNTLHRLQFHTAVEEFKSLETKRQCPLVLSEPCLASCRSHS